MGYPLFIAGTFWLGLPLKLAEQGVYLAACLLTAAMIRSTAPRESWAPASIFVVLALNPMLWSVELARIIREGLYMSLSLAVVALSAWVSCRPARRAAAALGQGALMGAVGAAFWLTREEGVWLVPAVAVNLGVGGIAAWRRRDRGAAARAGLPWGAAAIVFSTLVFGVAWTNAKHYGAFETDEVRSLPFRRAYGALARIRQEHPRRYVVLSKDARDAAYAVSPAARELAPVLDGPLGDVRRRAGCMEAEVTDCPEILSGWFQWALRDAVSAAGHYGSAADSAAYYTRLADEIDAACARGALSCLPPRATLVPPFRWEDAALAVRTFPLMARILVDLGSGNIGTAPSEGTPQSLAAVADIVGPIAPPVTLPAVIEGWAAAAAGAPAFRAGPEGTPPGSLATAPAPDVASAHPDLKAARFTLRTAGLAADADLVVDVPDGGETTIPLASLSTGTTLDAGGVTIHVDAGVARSLADQRRAVVVAVARRIAALYGGVLPAACLLACFGLAAAWAWRRRTSTPPLVVALALSSATAVLCRLILLSYLDATAIPALNALYPSPAAPLLLLFAALGCRLGIAAALGRYRRAPTLPGPDGR